MSLKLTYSEIVYLFADKFISQRARFANLEHHPGGEKFPVKPLGDLMVLASVLYLEKNGYIKMTVKDVKRMLIFNGKDVVAERLREPSEEITGIEEILLNNIKDATVLQKAIYNLLTSNDVLPWGPIINISKQSLVRKGYISAVQEKKLLGHVTKYSLVADKVREVENMVNELSGELSAFSADSRYSLINKEVVRGISARVEHESSDD